MSLKSTQCYWPNGDAVEDSAGYQPCNHGIDINHAACCALGNSVCTDNGYCLGNANYIYRGGCTDSSWESSSCPSSCSSAGDSTPLGSFSNIFDCGNGTASETSDQEWCCGSTDGSSCCDKTIHVTFGRPYFPVDNSASIASGTTTSTSVSSLTGSATSQPNTATPTPTSQASGSDSRTLGIGVGVGVGVGLLIIGITSWFMYTERKKRLAAEKRFEAILRGARDPGWARTELHASSSNKPNLTQVYITEADSQFRHEVPG